MLIAGAYEQIQIAPLALDQPTAQGRLRQPLLDLAIDRPEQSFRNFTDGRHLQVHAIQNHPSAPMPRLKGESPTTSRFLRISLKGSVFIKCGTGEVRQEIG